MSTLRADGFCEPTLHVRDLASIEVWERSLTRSRQRRRLAEVGRRARRWRKSASLAVSAALAAAPLIPRGVAAADSGSGPTPAGSTVDPADGQLTANAQRVVLHKGSHGALVAAAQRRLNEVLPLTHLAVDGIFGPLTRGAVMQFQRSHGLKLTGAIDVRTWAVMFKAPVVVMDGVSDGQGTGSGTGAGQPAVATAAASQHSSQFVSRTTPPAGPPTSARAASGSATGDAGAASAPSGGSSNSNGGVSQPVAVVAPSNPTSQPSTYVLSNGVALPLPRGYITNGSVDQGVDYSAPGGTPLFAMGDGVIIGEGISGFGPNAPILQITSGPLKGMEVYYGHAGSNLVHVGQHVTAGQQISIVGYGIVGISTGPHLEIGFYPPGPNGAGSRMLSLINSLMSQHSSGRAWGSRMATAHASSSPASSGSASHPSSDSASQTPSAPRAQAATDHPRTASPGGQSSSSRQSTERATSREVNSTGGSETRRADMQSASPAQSASASHPSAAESAPQTESTQGTGGGDHAPAGQTGPPPQPSSSPAPQPSSSPAPQPSSSPAPQPSAQPSPSPAAGPSPASSQTEPATQQPAEPAQPTPASPATPPAQAGPSDGSSPTGQPTASGTAGTDAGASPGDSQASSHNGDQKATATPDQTASAAATPEATTTAQTSPQAP